MSKKSGKQPRRFWSKKEEKFLIGCMRDLVNENTMWKLDIGQFKPGFYRECEKRIILAFPGTNLRANPHIDSKIKMWRKQYHVLQDALKLSGFGWDDTEKMITVDSDDVWDNFVRTHSDAKGMRNKPMPYYEDWLHLFGKDRATRDLAEGAAAVMDQEDATVEQGGESPVAQFTLATMDFSISGNGGQSTAAPSSSNVAGKKRGRSDGVTKGLSEMANAFGTFFAATNASMVEIAQGIGYNQNLSL